MGRQEPIALLQTAAAQGAATRPAKVLELHTAGAANRAYLQQEASGRVSLYFRGLHFGVDDYVPNSLAGNRSAWCGGTAGQFTCRQMLARHGHDEDAWPALARQFLLQHARSYAGTRAVSQRGPTAAKRAIGWRSIGMHFRIAHLFSQGTLSAS
jgi:hypothetical protein